MSDNIPLEIQVEIMKKLPVKSLIQFRSVSKTWKSLINGSDFIANYRGQQHLLVSCDYHNGYNENEYGDEQSYVSILDDAIFPEQKVTVTLPGDLLQHYYIIGCSHGLLCLFSRDGDTPRTGKAVIWNISIRKVVAVVVPNVDDMCTIELGFGVCPETTDPKIVKITQIREWNNAEPTYTPWQVEIFTLSTGVWSSPYTTNLLCKSIRFHFSQVVLDGFLYWLATDIHRITRDVGFRNYYLLISFDITSEEFREVILPDSLAYQSRFCMSKLRESLVLLECCEEANNRVFKLWMMEDDDPKSFTKLFTVDVNTQDAWLTGFTKSGEPIIGVLEYDQVVLVVYAPYSEHDNILEIEQEIESEFSVHSYMETLLLLNHPNLTVYSDI